jgi:hypothetical protein
VSDFLALEALMVDRLAAELPPTVRVMRAADMTSAKAGAPETVFVMFNGFRPKEPRGALVEVEQDWLTVVMLRNQKTLSADGARAEAGPVMAAVIDALLHHTFTGYKRLRLSSGPPPVYEGGMALFPIGWTTAVSLQGGCQ